MTTDQKHELVVLSKKEVAVLIAIFALVAMLSFTVGLKLGKNVALKTVDPHSSHATGQAEHDLHLEAEPNHVAAEDHAEEGHGDAPAGAHKSAANDDPEQKAENAADTELAAEMTSEKVAADKAITSHLPHGKKPSATQAAASKFTLQVGAYKTSTEASDRVAELKRKGLDAFYFDAKVPGKGVWYRVGIGLFSNKEAAEVAGSKWKTEKSLSSYIVQRISE